MIGEDKISSVPDTEAISARLRRTINSLISRIASCRRTLYCSSTTAGNGAGAESDLFVFHMPADRLEADCDDLIIEAAGTFAGTVAIDKRLRLKIGSTTLFDSGNLAITSAASWALSAHIARVAKTSEKCSTTLVTSDAALRATTTYLAATEDLSTSLAIKITGAGTNASDVVGQTFKVAIQPG